MDTVQMNKKIKEIMDSSDFYLLSEDVAKAIGVAPQKLREQAKDEPEKLGFNVIVVGTSIRIPRIPFLNYILGSILTERGLMYAERKTYRKLGRCACNN